jgi:DNA topoisomerase VI subunit B
MAAITVAQDGSRLTVQDNGPGLLQATIERSLDYLVRVSDKAHYVSPSRGQLGNALKCVWAAPYMLSPCGVGRVTVETGGLRYHIDVQLDQLAQQPQITLTVQEGEKRKTGTAISIDWPEKARLAQRTAHFLSSTLSSTVPPSGVCAFQPPHQLCVRGC